MERFIFNPMGTEAEEVFGSDDDKAKGAWVIAEVLVSDTNKHMAVIMLLSFDLGSAGVSFYDMAQFLYDNYSELQLIGLHKALTNSGGVMTKQMHYESKEQLEALREEADKMHAMAEKKLKEER